MNLHSDLGICYESCILLFLNISHKNSFKIMSSFFSKLLGEKRFVSNKINTFNTKISTRYWIICLHSKNICFYVWRTTDKCFNFFWNIFYIKTIKISNIIIFYVFQTTFAYIQSNPMSSNIRVIIKIYYIYPIPYFIG